MSEAKMDEKHTLYDKHRSMEIRQKIRKDYGWGLSETEVEERMEYLRWKVAQWIVETFWREAGGEMATVRDDTEGRLREPGLQDSGG